MHLKLNQASELGDELVVQFQSQRPGPPGRLPSDTLLNKFSHLSVVGVRPADHIGVFQPTG
jgi:hypothetical protein